MSVRWRWVLAAVILGFLITFNEGFRNHWQKRKYFRKLKKELAEIQNSNKNLAQELRRLKNDPDYLTDAARRELGMIRPGETEYQFVIQYSTPEEKP
ncbi:MAG: septum formation initiator family protein [Elusimicrobia bacterium]|nr:septum formation initiator family protein [Elusimicrobiota bacterium]MBI3012509.1 septum formation initiator family protein [Elusimicrobiota bacterium]MBI4217910.1 septum formation initiator family protein [Elusimicrobiota bacterium]